MLKTAFALQDIRTGRVSGIGNELSELAGAGQFKRLRAAVAYATRSGCRDLALSFENRLRGWRNVQKQWLVSIDFGTTEVEALKFLKNLPNSEVRIPDASQLLKSALFPERTFHPKTFILDSGNKSAQAPFAVFVGSANLTLSGRHAGVEHGISVLWLAPLTRKRKLYFLLAKLGI